MADINKTAGITLLQHTAITHPGEATGSVVDVKNTLAGLIFVYLAPVEAVAYGTPPRALVQASYLSTGNEDWLTIETFIPEVPGSGAPASEVLSSGAAAGASALPVASSSGFGIYELIYIQDTGVPADSEWHTVKRIETDAAIHVVGGIARAKDAADVIWGQAQMWHLYLDLIAVKRLRVVVVHYDTTGPNLHVMAKMVRANSIA